MGKKNKYGFERSFTRLLDGPFPFFVIRFYNPLHKIERENALRKALVKAAGDGLIDVRSYYYLLKISRLIEKKLIPEAAMFMDKYFDDFHCIIFCKCCFQSIQEIFRVLEKEALGNYKWKLITYVNGYKETELVYPRCMSLLEMACPLPGHPSHEASLCSGGQLDKEKKDPDPGVRSLLTADEESEQAGGHETPLHRVHTTERDFELDWELIEEALQKLYIRNPEEVSNMFNNQPIYIEELQHRVAEMIRCHSDSQTRIHKQLEQSLMAHLTGICLSISGYEGIVFLQEVSNNWTIFCSQVSWTVLLFNSVGPSWFTPLELGLSLWHKYIIAPGKLITTMVSHIISERDIQHNLMSELNEMLRLFPSTCENFEMEYVRASQIIYETNSAQARSLCSQSVFSCPEFIITAKVCHMWKDYFQYSDDYLGDELKLAKSYLGAKCQLLLLEAFHKHYFTKYNEWLKLCLKQSIDDDDYSLVGQMRSLLSRFPSGLVQMKGLLVSLVQDNFILVRDGPHDDVVNGEHVLLLRHKYNILINKSLGNDKTLEQAVNVTFRKIAYASKECTRCMTAYIDSRLRQTVTPKIEQDIEEAFQFVVKYVNGAAFKLFYWHYMADRLIKIASSHTAERQLIEMLKVQYGTAFTDSLEHMLAEIESQEETSEGFNSTFPNECPSTSFMVLNSRSWPMKQLESFVLPLDVRPMIERFEAHFLNLRGHRRKKVWLQAHLGSATLALTCSNGQRHELVVSTPQMCVLMLFNSADTLTYRQIQQATRMADANLRPCLRSLLSADGTSILTMEKNFENEFSENDILSFNQNFSGHLDLSWKHEIEPEKLVEIVDEAQKHHIEAAIARIMKQKKSLDHSSLVTAVTHTLEPLFITTPAAVKRRIENLIANGFLERERDDPNSYKYA